MRNRGIGLVLWMIGACPLGLLAQKTTAEKARAIHQIASKYHIAPRPLNDSFSVIVFRAMVEETDPYAVYFDQDDYLYLLNASLAMDEQIQKQSTAFLQTFHFKYAAARKRFLQQAKTILATPLQFSTKEYFAANGIGNEGKMPQQPQEQRVKWYLKWRVLAALAGMQTNDSAGLTPAFVQKNQTAAQKEVVSFFEKRYQRFSTDSLAIKQWLEKTYLNAIAKAYDPHTEYFSHQDYDEFEGSLNSESLAYGFGLIPNSEGNLTVNSVLPGSAAWQSNNIHEGDVIIAIKPQGAPAISVASASPEELNALFEKYADQTVEFTIKAADGTTRTVKLKKQAIRNEDNVVRGWILDGQPKIGYISLPSFYTQSEDGMGTSSAEDVAREIVKLKQEKIEGLVLDLRFNGGGSIDEAAAMLGIFIDIGPLGVTKIYDGRRETIKDLNRGTIYDGPLVVMVNGASASASEILAATLQDYRKAIIAGSTTFGKATMQIVVPLKNNFDLDQYDPSKEKEDESTEYLKLTIGKLYRVSGKTAQNTGVVPDVYLPDYFEAGQFTERSYPTSLPADTVVVGFTPRIMPEKYHAATLQQFVQTSVLTDPQFVQLQQEVEKIKHNGTDRVPLLLEEFDAWNKTLEEEPTAMADTIATNLAFKVANTRLDADYNTMDAYQKENDEAIMEDLHADQWLRQVYLLFKKILIK